MDKLLVHGGTPLQGAINISGSKNASLPILAASILTGEDCLISRVPDVSDTNYMVQILSALGANVERYSGTVRISCADISEEAPYDLVRRMRASICVMGPLLARKHRAVVSSQVVASSATARWTSTSAASKRSVPRSSSKAAT